MPQIGDVVDFTARRRQLPAKHLSRCPTCGRIGELHVFRNGDASYIHRRRLRTWYWEVLDACYVKSTQQP